MKKMLMMLMMAGAGVVLADPTLTVTNVTAQQRYPWNGKVDIAVTIQGEVSEVAKYGCTFAATNCATATAVPITGVA